jgi:uncharacterized protein
MRSLRALGLSPLLLVLPACTPPAGTATDPSGAAATQSAAAPSAADPSASPPVASAAPSASAAPVPHFGGMANPAAVNCIKNGGHLALHHEPAGDTSDCVFPDGSVCEQWAFFRHECQPKTK